MSKRSEKEARESADLVTLLAPALAATALLAYFHYRGLKKQFLSGAQVKRIDDLEAHIPILAISTIGIVSVLWCLYAFAMWAFRGHAAFIPVVALAAYAAWLLIKRLLAAQAACLLGWWWISKQVPSPFRRSSLHSEPYRSQRLPSSPAKTATSCTSPESLAPTRSDSATSVDAMNASTC